MIAPHINVVFLDMDGVLFDFIGGALVAVREEFNRDNTTSAEYFNVAKFLEEWPPGQWDICELLELEPEAFWGIVHLHNRGRFWRSLDPYDWFDQLMQTAKRFPEVRLLSSPADDPSCYSGKKVLRDEHCPHVPLILCKEKHFLAAPDRLLIDDNDLNVDRWRKAGGEAILFPQLWNANHQWRDAPLAYVGMELARLYQRSQPANN